MNNLQKFNQTLEDFSQEVEELKDVSEAYKKLQRLIGTYGEITNQFTENNKTLEKINELQKVQQERVNKSLAELENVNKQNKIELVKLIEEKTDQIRKENKEFYKDLESTIKIKLDENKSQIKQLIEIERSQIKQIFEIELAKNTNELKQTFEAEIQKQTNMILKGQKSIKISLWIIGGMPLILSILMFLKIFGII